MNNDHYFLQPGYIIMPEKAVNISTVTGSSVSVSVFDKKHKIAGMNNFQLPFMEAKGKTTALYGNIATITLIKMILSHELFNSSSEPLSKLSYRSRIKHLEAQIFGGAYNNQKSDLDIGKQNIETARKILQRYKIPIISEDIGGAKGRKIVFNTSTNEAAVLKVDNLRDDDWYPYQNSEI